MNVSDNSPNNGPNNTQYDNHRTLPLFGKSGERRSERRRQPVNPHLRAARKLSKDMRRLADRSVEQTLTGRAICQHLRALLREGESQTTELHS